MVIFGDMNATEPGLPPKGEWKGPAEGRQVGGSKGVKKPPASLSASRWVSKHPKKEGETGLVKMYRDLQESDPGKFLAELRGMEREWGLVKARGAVACGGSKEAEVVEDLGTDRCVELCEAWLREWTEKNKN